MLAQRYLLCIGLLTLAGNIVNTGGNYIRDATVFAAAEAEAAAGAALTAQQIVVNYMAGMDFWQNILAMTLQFFVVSRIFKYFGIGGALFVLPLIALGSVGQLQGVHWQVVGFQHRMGVAAGDDEHALALRAALVRYAQTLREQAQAKGAALRRSRG